MEEIDLENLVSLVNKLAPRESKRYTVPLKLVEMAKKESAAFLRLLRDAGLQYVIAIKTTEKGEIEIRRW